MGQKSFIEEFAEREQVPAEILKVANLVKSIDMEEFKEFKEDNHHFGKFPDTLILIYTMDKIANLKRLTYVQCSSFPQQAPGCACGTARVYPD